MQPTGQVLGFNNTNALVKNAQWDIQLSKTGYIREAGKCLVMLATIASKPFVIVLLDSVGKYTRLGDAQRVRHWLETGEALPATAAKGAPRPRRQSVSDTPAKKAPPPASPTPAGIRRGSDAPSESRRFALSPSSIPAVPLEQFLRMRPRLRGDLAAREHPRELLDPRPARKRRDVRPTTSRRRAW